MDYGKIISTGFKQAWKYKSLWILGFLVSGGGGGFFDLFQNFGQREYGDFGGFGGFGKAEIQRLIMDYLPIIILVGLGVLLLGLIFWILSTIANGALVDAARCLKENRDYRFGSSWRIGMSKFWSIFGLGLLNFVILFAFIILLVIIGFIAFKLNTVIGVLSLVIMIPLLLITIFLMVTTVAVATRVIVIEDKPVFDSIADGFNLWKAKFGQTVLYAILYFFLSLGVGIATIFVLIPLILPFVAIGFANIWLAILTGVPVLIVFLVIVSGYTGASLHLMTTEFYYQLRGITGEPVPAAIPPGNYPPPTYTPFPPPPPPVPDVPFPQQPIEPSSAESAPPIEPDNGPPPENPPSLSSDEPQRPDTDR